MDAFDQQINPEENLSAKMPKSPDLEERLFLLEVLYNRPGHKHFMRKHNGNLEAMFADPEFQAMLAMQETYWNQENP